MESVEGESRGNSHATISVMSETGEVSLGWRMGRRADCCEENESASDSFPYRFVIVPSLLLRAVCIPSASPSKRKPGGLPQLDLP